MNITIFGHGNLASAVGKNFELAGNTVQYITHENGVTLGDIVVLGVPYQAVDDVVDRYRDQLNSRIIVDATNPLDFQTFKLLVPADMSAALQLKMRIPDADVLKAFNTTTAVNLSAGKMGDGTPSQVLMAGDSEDAKKTLADALSGSPLEVIDAGGIAEARDMEALGRLQLRMMFAKQAGFTGGFRMVK
ncbi:MAG: NAD(P)-binding domain-containing protein [Bifidobacterium choerinum]